MLPQAFIDNMRAQFPDEAEPLFAALDQPYAAALRLNTLRGAISTLEAIAAPFTDGTVPWCGAGRYIKEGTRPGLSPLHHTPLYYIQEASAMAPAVLLNAQPGEYVLDLCAAPGGKSSLLAASLRGEGLLVSCEPDSGRASILSSTLERMGVKNAAVINAYPGAIARAFPAFFDAVLVDAPCSGEGMFRRDIASRDAWLDGSCAGCASRQAEILDEAAKTVKPGGRLIYSTCTFDRRENEDNVSAFLERHGDFSIEDFELPGLGRSENGGLHVWPHKARGDGQFMARLRRAGESPQKSAPKAPKTAKPDRDTQRAIEQLMAIAPGLEARGEIVRRGDMLLLVPRDMPDLSGLRVLRDGLRLARAGKNYVEPDHALAMALFPEQAAGALDLDDKGALRYLAGETFDASGRGWTLVTHRGLPLGWGKIANGTLKNHLPKGLRRAGR